MAEHEAIDEAINLRAVSEWMTEDDAWNELADLETAGFRYNLEGREMSRFVFCGECGKLKHIETEPYAHGSTANFGWSGPWCACPDEEIERDIEEAVKAAREERAMIREYADYAKQEIRCCPYCGAALGMREWVNK